MKTKLLQIALLAVALVAYGCTNKETEVPENTESSVGTTPPVADAGADQIVAAGNTVTLAGAGSDVDSSIANYSWSQISGTPVSLAVGGANASFTAPAVEKPEILVFELRVTDDGGTDSEPDSLTVTIFPAYDKFLGTAVEQPEDYTPLHPVFTQITPGNAGKWGSVEGTQDVMDWTNLDTIHTFAENQGLRFKHHNLFWGQQQPAWLKDLSAEEQLAEINEWLTSLEARYGDLDMIDVVNEPLHAPPAYIEALGGEGETGWDWLITAFELARDHFPNSTLILNDYHILNLEENTEDYVLLVNLLRDLDLIDGIGVQAHFLEQVSAETVKQNLDLLGATGLPIYVSEFDINYADDARHANKLAELFTVFWEHPAVAGVTHWGYREGAVWRENAWLQNSDGTERPALAWLRCYAIEGNEDCVLPEYVPAGWAGDASGLVLEAELYDQGEGVQASGNIVSHADAGDWAVFRSVQFQTDWDSLKVKYAKGGDTTGSLSVRLDCGDDINSCAEVASIPLPPTGGWSNFRTVNVPWTPSDGTHDLFLRFMSVASVGNIDWLRFGPTDVVQVNLVDSGGFEGDSIDSGWSVWYTAEGELALTDMANSGSQGMSLTGRTNAGANRASYDLTDKVETGETYPVSAWVTHSGPDAARITLSYKLRCNDVPDADSTYHGIEDNSEVPANEWTKLSGELEIPADCSVINEVRIYFENTPLDVETLYYDDVEVLGWGTAAAPEENNLVSNGDFESDTSGWESMDGNGMISTSDAYAHSGESSMLVSGTTASSGYVQYWLTDHVTPGTTYPITAWALHTGESADTIRMTGNIECAEGTAPEGHNPYPWLQNAENVEPGEWMAFSTELVIPECEITQVRIFFEGTSPGTDVYIDEVSVTEQ